MLCSARFGQLAGTGLLVATSAACAATQPLVYSDPAPEAAGIRHVSASSSEIRPVPRVSDHVIVISIDGLRPDAIDRFGAGTLQRLIREGSYSLEATTITPSITLPSHASMLTGVEPSVHGITWNENQVEEVGRVVVPTIFSLARSGGLHTAAFFSKGKFDHLILPGSVDHAVLPEGDGFWLADRTAEEVENYLASERPNLTFVHFGDTDYAGHLIGWMSPVYGWAVDMADAAVARVLAAADEAFGPGGYTVIVTSDHGGHGRTHGTTEEADMTIPWIAWGKGVRSGVELPATIHTTDTAATALWLLGLATPPDLAGAPVQTAFDAPNALPGGLHPHPADIATQPGSQLLGR
ncbi:MAG: sulfatase-like hydrolase/transferase [Gemmatimonas sp.]|nr:sulfatase-like hydrolase/transferase [Gemmatimonas sp.]